MMRLLLLLALLPLLYVQYADASLADEALSRQQRWHLGEGLAEGDAFSYVICRAGAGGTCSDVSLEFARIDPGYWLVEAEVRHLLGHHTAEGRAFAGPDIVPTGDPRADIRNIEYVGAGGASAPISLALRVDERWGAEPIAYSGESAELAAILQDTIFLLGGGIRTGSGPVPAGHAILSVGEQWARPGSDTDVMVTSSRTAYEFGGARMEGGIYRVEYSTNGPALYALVMDGFPLPLYGEVVSDDLVRDPHISRKFWFALVPGGMNSSVEGPSAYATGQDAVTEASPGPAPESPAQGTLGDITDAAEGIPARLYELFLEFLGTITDSQEPLTISGEATYAEDEQIALSGRAAGPAEVRLYSGGAPVASVPADVQDGKYELSLPPGMLPLGVIEAEVIHGEDSARTSFEVVAVQHDPAANPHGEDVSYNALNRDILDYTVYSDSVIFHLDDGGAGVLTVTIPGRVFDASEYDVYADGAAAAHGASGTDPAVLTIPVAPGAAAVEIIPLVPAGILVPECMGSAECITSEVVRVIDGDTIKIGGNRNIRLALSSAPELSEPGGTEAKAFAEMLCPAGAAVLVDGDDGQTEGSYGRTIGMVYCNGSSLNEELLDSGHGTLSGRFCADSEFAGMPWARRHGCQ
ncbi:micrococcal nuclease-like protein [Cenarchaeum symbiosum A]|uniref:Micrococcal nuclease-like protein n=1 Tax=Cenarchaeum symbiosum (strain A) TaxID=414004 RepID=A0RVF4_CENSY|nr:micrococcal nuclease-like protein [Cenarchaeum symbiosum A]